MIKHISSSSLGSWLRCGEQFRRRYIEGEIIPPGISARRGGAVHKTAEINYRQKKTTEVDLPLSDMQDATRDNYVETIKEKGVFIPQSELPGKDRLLNDGLNQAIEATKIYHKDVAPQNQPKIIEQSFSADIGLDLPVTGIVDLITQENKIKDLKIMKKKNQAWADNELQPTFYYILAKENELQVNNEFEYQIVVPNKKMIFDPISTKRDEGDVERLKQYIRAFLQSLKSGMFAPCEPGHWLCDPMWCGYALTCAYRKR